MRDTKFITKDTNLYVSLAERPGNNGTAWFNKMFGQYEIDAIYKAFKVNRNDFDKAFQGVRGLAIAGGAISMPFKKQAANLVDRLEGVALELGVINTFRRERNGELIGFNTDYEAALRAIPENMNSIYLLGSGGVAASVAWAIRKKQAGPLTVIARSAARSCISSAVEFKWCFWREMQNLPAPQVLINCTSLGMTSAEELHIPDHWWEGLKLVTDLTYRPEGNLFSQKAKAKNIQLIDGKLFSRWQAVEQFRIYTGIEIKSWEGD